MSRFSTAPHLDLRLGRHDLHQRLRRRHRRCRRCAPPTAAVPSTGAHQTQQLALGSRPIELGARGVDLALAPRASCPARCSASRRSAPLLRANDRQSAAISRGPLAPSRHGARHRRSAAVGAVAGALLGQRQRLGQTAGVGLEPCQPANPPLVLQMLLGQTLLQPGSSADSGASRGAPAPGRSSAASRAVAHSTCACTCAGLRGAPALAVAQAVSSSTNRSPASTRPSSTCNACTRRRLDRRQRLGLAARHGAALGIDDDIGAPDHRPGHERQHQQHQRPRSSAPRAKTSRACSDNAAGRNSASSAVCSRRRELAAMRPGHGPRRAITDRRNSPGLQTVAQAHTAPPCCRPCSECRCRADCAATPRLLPTSAIWPRSHHHDAVGATHRRAGAR